MSEFETADWHRALTLAERKFRLDGKMPIPSAAARDSERARTHLESWKRQAPFDRQDWLARRLASEGFDEASFGRLLEVPPEELSLGGPLPWLTALTEAYSRPEWPGADSLPLPESVRKDPMAGFLNLVVPLIQRGLGRFRNGVEAIASGGGTLPCDPVEAERQIFSALPAKLLWMLDRTLVLELNVARVEGKLSGSSPEARFGSFVERLRRFEPASSFKGFRPTGPRCVPVSSVERTRERSRTCERAPETRIAGAEAWRSCSSKQAGNWSISRVPCPWMPTFNSCWNG
jgi:hypothetical protein